MACYLITGTARGLGLELTRQLSELPPSRVGQIFAVTRSAPPLPLQHLIDKSNDRIINIITFVEDTESVERAADEVRGYLGRGKGLDVLVNNAAIQWKSSNGKTDGFRPEELMGVLNTNVVGPHRMIVAFLPLLRAGGLKKVINVSSSMGSIEWADAFAKAPGQAYKTSKSALHMLNKQYALDYAEDGFTFLCVSPGHLKTDLGGYGDFTVDVGAAELKRIIFESTTAHNGKLLNIHVPGHENDHGKYDGTEIPW